jgi:undecaprenyl-diphosphatase
MKSNASLVRRILGRVTPRDRDELRLLVGAIALVAIALGLLALVGNVMEGATQQFDERILRALRKADAPQQPIGPPWMKFVAEDITALGGSTVLGLTVLAVVGFLLLYRMYRNALFVFVATVGGALLNAFLKGLFERQRPSVVPHLRDAVGLSFPSGHAMTSAIVYLTLGALLMRFATRPLAKWYCMSLAMAATFLVGSSRVYLGVHYPTDVVAGWLIGLSWAIVFWLIEHALEQRAGLKKERNEAK